jgi:hypothetical protein
MIPKQVKVGIYDCEVKEVKDLKWEDRKMDGMLSCKEQLIEIDQDISPLSKEVTLWHEMIHMVDRQYGLRLGERVTDCLAHGIIGILKDNKELCQK